MKYVPFVRNGDEIEIRIPALNRTFTAKISRFTHKVETDTRTMDVEADVSNPDLSLYPGMYATAVLTLEHREKVLSVPIQAVERGKSPSVLLVNGGRTLEERSVKLGLETPERVEILSGLKEGDLVVIGSRTLFKPGQKVEPKLIN
jgi:RND family efflux transporter MFP subunit